MPCFRVFGVFGGCCFLTTENTEYTEGCGFTTDGQSLERRAEFRDRA